MVDAKVDDVLATGADTLLGGDLGCLLNIAGRLYRRGADVRVRHVAEVLAGATDGNAADRRRERADTGSAAPTAVNQADKGAGREEGCNRPRACFPTTPTGRSADANLQAVARPLQPGVSGQAPAGDRTAAGIRRAARRGESDQGPHARTSRLLSRTVRSEGDETPAAQVHWCADAEDGPPEGARRSAAKPARAPSPRASR